MIFQKPTSLLLVCFYPNLNKQVYYFTESKVTADFIVDVLDDFGRLNQTIGKWFVTINPDKIKSMADMSNY